MKPAWERAEPVDNTKHDGHMHGEFMIYEDSAPETKGASCRVAGALLAARHGANESKGSICSTPVAQQGVPKLNGTRDILCERGNQMPAPGSWSDLVELSKPRVNIGKP